MTFKVKYLDRKDIILENVSTCPVTGCWLWLGAVNKLGYGQSRNNKKQMPAHRLSYEVFKQSIPKGLLVRHMCDVPGCVNPDHLEVGTPSDNNQDMLRRRRCPTGENCWHSKYKERTILELRKAHSTGKYFHRELAEMFGISRRYVSQLVKGKKAWQHIQPKQQD